MGEHIWIIRFFKAHIPFWFRILLIRILCSFQKNWYGLFPKSRAWGQGKKVFIFFSTDYPNLGDHALSISHIRLIKEMYPNAQINELLVGETYKYLKDIKKHCSKEDVITMKGGGNVGLEYFREELMRRSVIETFPDNRIIMFPQTVYFPDTDQGKKEFDNTVKIMNKHDSFYAFFRDRKSYEILGTKLQHGYLTPDIVFSLRKLDYTEKRHGIVTCMRKDQEGIFDEKYKKELFSHLSKLADGDLTITDTIQYYKIEPEDREKELEKIWNTIGNANVLVTDRLHGMVFAVLLGTPCIVMNTYNHKLIGQYEWVKDLNYVQFYDKDKDDLDYLVKQMMSINVDRIKPAYFEMYFKLLKDVISGNA